MDLCLFKGVVTPYISVNPKEMVTGENRKNVFYGDLAVFHPKAVNQIIPQ
ncbi:hypothetical protein VIBNISFn118_640011 [Vibrio nigripulchritudo SFn118]|nr:hypothetical protein VIBNISFn118_640011 [Vibrio nigripulchritudo SFn118]